MSTGTTKYGVQVDTWGAIISNRGDKEKDIQAKVSEKLGMPKEGDTQPTNSVGGYTKTTYGWIKNVNLRFWELTDIPYVSDLRLDGQGRPHVLIQSFLGWRKSMGVAVRVAKNGDDLEVSWRLFERDYLQSVLQPLLELFIIINFGGAVWANLSGILGIGGSSQAQNQFGFAPTPISILITQLLVSVLILVVVLIGERLVIDWIRRLPDGTRQTYLSPYDQFDSRVLAQRVHAAILQALDEFAIAPGEIREVMRTQVSDLKKIV